MITIKEDFVSFETAKLLKEKGFKTPVETGYYGDGRICHNLALDFMDYNHEDGYYSRPTIQMAMKWLREVHNIGIFPSTYTHIADRKTIHSYGTAIINLKTYELMTDNYLSNDTYEEAIEAGIKYCLENLI